MTPHPAPVGPPVAGGELTVCPQCGAPASLVPLHEDGDAHDHVRIWCSGGHWFLMPRDLLGRLPGP